ncbi:hypothetical protein DRN39_04640 [Thermococci archaeon]|nr:MAG: hypothetical protein DRN39_04640 [Thermococci archaeon]
MRKVVFVMVLILLASTLPMGMSQPWISVFEGKVKIGETLILGDYHVKITQGYTNNSQVQEPYAIIYKGEQIKDVAELKDIIEVEDIRIIPGSFNEETQEIFIVLQYKPTLATEIAPKAGTSFEIDGYSIKILESSNESISLKINGNDMLVKDNSSRVYDRLALVYNEGILRVYHAGVQVKIEEKKDYEIYYPFEGLKAEAGSKIQVPITVINNGREDLNLPLKVVSKPSGWEVRFLEGGNNYEVSKINVKTGSSANLILQIDIPVGVKGKNSVSFAVGNETRKITFDVIEKEGMEVKTPLLGVEAEAGNTVTFPIDLINHGDERGIELEIKEKPANWDAYFTLNGQRIRSFLLDKSGQITLVVKTPRNAELGKHEIRFSVNGMEKSVSVFIYKTHKGEPAKLILSIVDDGGKPVAKAKVQIENETYIADSNGVLERELPKGNYTITVSKEGYESKEEKIILEDGEKKEETVTLKRLSYYFTVEMESNHLTTGFNNQPSYEIRIKNLGKEDDEYALSIEGLPSDWAVNFLRDTQSNLEIKSIKVDSGEARSVYLRIIPSFNAQPGVYNATLRLRSSSGNEIEKRIEVEVIGKYMLSIETSNYLVSLKPDEEKSIPLILRNLGNTVTNVNIEVNAPKGWDIRVEPQKLAKIEGKNIETITLYIKPSKTTPAGEYRISIDVKSDQAESQIQLTARVRQSSSSAYMGVIILVVAFAAVILMMRRVGRR